MKNLSCMISPGSRARKNGERRTKIESTVDSAVTCVGRKKGGRFEIFNQESNRSPLSTEEHEDESWYSIVAAIDVS